MTINFYLDDASETEIMCFYEMTSNPFKLGDEVGLNVDSLFPVELEKYTLERKLRITERNDKSREMFHNRTVILVKEGKYARFNELNEPKLTIEYHCTIKPIEQ